MPLVLCALWIPGLITIPFVLLAILLPRNGATVLAFAAAALLLTFTLGETAHAQGEAREPGPGAKPHHAYEATSSAGLRYTWAIPKDVPVAGERGMAANC